MTAQPVPSQAQRDEVAKLQGLQVRTNAIQLAVALHAGREIPIGDVLAVARDIESYIAGF